MLANLPKVLTYGLHEKHYSINLWKVPPYWGIYTVLNRFNLLLVPFTLQLFSPHYLIKGRVWNPPPQVFLLETFSITSAIATD